jgi:Cupredoxin-like domain
VGLSCYAAGREGLRFRGVLTVQVLLRPSPKTALLALTALAAPVPAALASARTPNKAHRVQRATVLARKTRRHGHHHTAAAGKPTLIFRISRPSATKKKHHRRHHPRRHLAHAAGDPVDTISDFKFSPSSVTIHVGDTITWTNNGPTAHTATASNGSFDTGILKKGQSASHTFSQAGTFAYICSLHPFMHGTVVVVGSTSSGSGSSSGSGASGAASGNTGSGTGASSAGSSSPTASSASSATLPNTGLNVSAALGTALLLIGLGVTIRRRVARRSAL